MKTKNWRRIVEFLVVTLALSLSTQIVTATTPKESEKSSAVKEAVDKDKESPGKIKKEKGLTWAEKSVGETAREKGLSEKERETALNVLNQLVKDGVPVDHARDVVREALREGKTGQDVAVFAKSFSLLAKGEDSGEAFKIVREGFRAGLSNEAIGNILDGSQKALAEGASLNEIRHVVKEALRKGGELGAQDALASFTKLVAEGLDEGEARNVVLRTMKEKEKNEGEKDELDEEKEEEKRKEKEQKFSEKLEKERGKIEKDMERDKEKLEREKEKERKKMERDIERKLEEKRIEREGRKEKAEKERDEEKREERRDRDRDRDRERDRDKDKSGGDSSGSGSDRD